MKTLSRSGELARVCEAVCDALCEAVREAVYEAVCAVRSNHKGPYVAAGRSKAHRLQRWRQES